MTQWRIGNTRRNGLGSADGGEIFMALGPGGVAASAENAYETKVYNAYTFSDLRVRITTLTSGSATCSLRDDGTNTSVSVAVSGTGWSEDLTDSNTPAANSLLQIHHDDNGMHNDTMVVWGNLVTYEHGSIDAPIFSAGRAGSESIDTYWPPPNKSDLQGNRNNVRWQPQRSYAFSNLHVQTTGVTGQWTVSPHEIVGGKSSAVTVTFTSTGQYEDTTGSETYGDGDDVAMNAREDSAGSWFPDIIQVEVDTAESVYANAGADPISTVRNWAVFTGLDDVTAGGDADNWTMRMGSQTAAYFEAVGAVSLSVTIDVGIRVGGADSTAVALSVTGAGYFEDLTGSESLADADALAFFLQAQSGSGTISCMSIELPWSDPGGGPVGQPAIKRTWGVPTGPGSRVGSPNWN